MTRTGIAASVIAILMAGCGGGGGGSGGGGNPNPPPSPTTYTVSGTITGLAGTGLILQNNGTNDLSITQDGAFAFTSAITSGSAYNVTVLTQPSSPSQTCTVANGTGTITANVTNVAVTCVTGAYAVGGTVSGLAANSTGLALINNADETLEIDDNGAFNFAPIVSGGSYDIRILTQPVAPYQSCTIENGAGTVANASISTVVVACETNVSRFATALNFESGTYAQYAIDDATGQLRMRGFAPVGRNPIDVNSFGSEGKISFVLSRGDARLHAFARDSVTGRLTEASNSPQLTGAIPSPGPMPATGAASITVHPKLNFVYVANGAGTTTIAGFQFHATSGALTPIPGSPFAAGDRPVKLAIDPSGRFAYASNRDAGSIDSYTIDQTTGALTPIGAAIANGATEPTFPVVHHTGKFLYVANASGSISVFSIGSTGELTALAGSPFAVGEALAAPILLHSSGKYLYVKTVGGGSPHTITALAIDQTTGALSVIGAPASIGVNPTTVWLESSGRYVFVANRGTAPQTSTTVGSLAVLRIDPATGALSQTSSIENMSPPPYSVSLDWGGKYAYSASADGNLVRSYAFDFASGVLTPLADQPQVAGHGAPLTLIAVPSENAQPAEFRSKFGYVPNQTASTISAFSINASTGAFTATTGVGTSPTISGVDALAVVPGASRLIAVNRTGVPTVRTFPINATTGALGNSSTAVGAGALPRGLVVEPSGRFAYALDESGNGTIRGYRVDESNGAVTALPVASATQIGPLELAMHPNGRYVYYISNTHWGVRRIDSDDGSLALVSDTATAATGNSAIAIHPSGNFAYIARGADRIDIYRIHNLGATAGSLIAPTSVTSGGNAPSAIAIDPTGRFLYVANQASTNLAAFRVNADSGALTPIGTPTALQSAANSLRVDYSGAFLYVIDSAQRILTFAITSTGALQTNPLEGPATDAGPRELALSEDIE